MTEPHPKLVEGSEDDNVLDLLSKSLTRATDAAGQGDEHASDDALIERALFAARSKKRRREKGRHLWPLAAAAAFLIVGTTAAIVPWTGQSTDSIAEDNSAALPSAPPTVLELPTGDRLLATSGADFQLSHHYEGDRRISLTDGSMLFDVAPQISAQNFAVRTPHLIATVEGTVFSVQVDDDVSRVHVYEGIVRVTHGGHIYRLSESDSYDTRLGEVHLGDAAAFRREGLTAARARATGPQAQVAPVARSVPAISGAQPVRAAPPEHTASESPSVGLSAVRALLDEGEYRQVTELADEAHSLGRTTGGWWMAEGDARRALQQFSRAVLCYENAARELPSFSERAQAAYLAAWVHANNLNAPDAALRTLASGPALGSASPIRERAWVLKIRILVNAGRDDEARADAAAYIQAYSASQQTWIEELAR